MKTHIYLIALLFTISLNSISQNKTKSEIYYDDMTTALATLRQAEHFEQHLDAAHQFKRIAEEEKTKWIPFYHAAHAYTRSGILASNTEEAVNLIDTGQDMLDKAIEYGTYNNSEIVCLQGLVYYARQLKMPGITNNDYAIKAIKEIDKARFIDKSNPRTYYLIAVIFNQMPVELGGNKESACNHFIRAEEKFTEFTPRSEFYPIWGRFDNLRQLQKCNQQ